MKILVLVKKSDQKPTFKNESGQREPLIYKALRGFWSNGQIFFNIGQKNSKYYIYVINAKK